VIARRIVPLPAVLATGCAGTMDDGRPDTEQAIWLREDAKQEFYKCLRSKGYHEEKVKRP
jgi:hypothetical protein